MLSTQLDRQDISENILNDDTLSDLHIDRNFITSSKDNVAASIVDDRPSIQMNTGDKLHRRNPVTVRQEIQSFDDLIPETNLSDLQLSEMPGLQNTEQWKRIAGRIGQASPPLSRQYFQTATCIFESQNGHIPEVLGSYRRPGRTENEHEISSIAPSLFQTSRRKILFSFLFTITITAILIAIVVAVVLVRKPKQVTTDCYSGSIFVQADFDHILLSSSSTLANNYQREFCSLIGTTLADTKTKYAIFYSSCSISHFRNGSIIGDFTLGFTRYQNVTRLNAFLSRTIVSKQLFGGTILSIVFNSTDDMATNDTDYDSEYTTNETMDFGTTEQSLNITNYTLDEEKSTTMNNALFASDMTFIQSTNQSDAILPTSTRSTTKLLNK